MVPDPVTGTFSGHRGLQLEEPLIFEQDASGRTGVDLPEPPAGRDRLNGLRRPGPTGRPAVAMSPAAGAHGELCGVMTMRAALEDRGDPRRRILVPESAHGTNPATAAACGYAVEAVPANARGRVGLAAFQGKVGAAGAGI